MNNEQDPQLHPTAALSLTTHRWGFGEYLEVVIASGAVTGLIALPELVPASLEAVFEAKRLLGHSLPPLLRRIYLEVANGGFGPDILGVAGGHEVRMRIVDSSAFLSVISIIFASDPVTNGGS